MAARNGGKIDIKTPSAPDSRHIEVPRNDPMRAPLHERRTFNPSPFGAVRAIVLTVFLKTGAKALAHRADAVLRRIGALVGSQRYRIMDRFRE